MPTLMRSRKPPTWETVVSLQKWIAKILFFILIMLILFSAFGNKETVQILNNSYLPVISGWIGIILGFYFSKELAGIIAEKLKRTEEERDQAIRDANISATRAIESLIVTLKVKEKQGKNGIRKQR